MSETNETMTSATADVATAEPKTAAPAKKEKNPARPIKEVTSSTGNLSIIDPKSKLGSGYNDAEREKLMKLYDQTFNALKADQVVKGKIVAITPSEIAVDIGFKSEGIISRSEFSMLPDIKVGDEVEVLVEAVEDREGRLQLSHKRANFIRVWERVGEAAKTGEVMQVKVTRRIKGGLVVDLLGMEAFMPGSQIDIKPVRDFDAFLGQTMDVRVVKINHPSENVVVSHKVLLEDTLNEQRQKVVEKLERGQVLEGTVKAITDFGAFIDLGGVDGLVHITDLSWGRVSHPSEIVKLDQTVTIVVLDYDENKKRISLGMKQLQPHPWAEIEQRYAVGQHVKGKIVSMTDYGAFLEIEKGIEGLIHVSEMSWTTHVKHPSQLFAIGQDVEAQILSIDQDSKKISLGVKQLEPDPWSKFLEKYPIGSVHKGIVRNLTNFGAFVEIEPGVDGLVHIGDLSWTKKVRHPGELLKKNDSIDVMILGIDTENRRIALGHKQVSENPWDSLGEAFSEGTDTTGKIIRFLEKGVVVELPGGIDGFVPASQLSFQPVRNVADSFKLDETLNLRVIEFDSENKKIVLSATEWLKAQDRAIVEDYNEKHPIPKETLEESSKKSRTRRSGTKKAAASTGDEHAASQSHPASEAIGTFELPGEMTHSDEAAPTAEAPAAEEPTASAE
ncbi:MAG TPA: 30S ribosomal protein S1 [Candidatus Kapabacteria bacterium]|nr:30S ribosomal protein S1 [Candidatus Kapabacteria bacterium]